MDSRTRGHLVSARTTFLLGLGFVVASALGAQAQWTQFGGPERAFIPACDDLAKTWPESGPPERWRRKLGEGYSSILADGGRLYTMYRAAAKERVVCMDAATGKTLWEYAYSSGPQEGHYDKFGNGPCSTPLLTRGVLYTVGIGGAMHSLNADTGEVFWAKDLAREFGVEMPDCGYSASPTEHEGTIIVPIGRNMSDVGGIVAMNKTNGEVVWKNMGHTSSYSTPKFMKIHGESQLIVFMGKEVVAIDPDSGSIKWRFPCMNGLRENISLPLLIDENTVLISAVNVGTMALKIVKDESGFKAEQLWKNRKVQFYHGSTIQIGDYVYGSSGETAPHFLVAINVRDGERAWRRRISKSNLLLIEGRLIILDGHGNLLLATASPEGLDIHSKFELLQSTTWTPPTLVEGNLYVRDQASIVSLNLGQ